MTDRAAAERPVQPRRAGLRTRAEIVAAAERHFAESGFEAARLEDIASEVGIRRAAIFYHFGDKQELYRAVLDDVFGDWTPALPAEGSAAARLEAAIGSWIDYIAARPSVARLILREAANAKSGEVSPFVGAASAALAWFLTVIEEGIASGELRPLTGPQRFLSLMGGITVFHLFGSMPWMTVGQPVDRLGPSELAAHKREILMVARRMLGLGLSPHAQVA